MPTQTLIRLRFYLLIWLGQQQKSFLPPNHESITGRASLGLIYSLPDSRRHRLWAPLSKKKPLYRRGFIDRRVTAIDWSVWNLCSPKSSRHQFCCSCCLHIFYMTAFRLLWSAFARKKTDKRESRGRKEKVLESFFLCLSLSPFYIIARKERGVGTGSSIFHRLHH